MKTDSDGEPSANVRFRPKADISSYPVRFFGNAYCSLSLNGVSLPVFGSNWLRGTKLRFLP